MPRNCRIDETVLWESEKWTMRVIEARFSCTKCTRRNHELEQQTAASCAIIDEISFSSSVRVTESVSGDDISNRHFSPESQLPPPEKYKKKRNCTVKRISRFKSHLNVTIFAQWETGWKLIDVSLPLSLSILELPIFSHLPSGTSTTRFG